MRFTDDIARGGWIAPRLHGWGSVSGTVPTGFPAYARVFHPVALSTVIDGAHGPERIFRPLTWHGVADALGTVAHPAMQWSAVTRGQEDAEVEGWEVEPPRTGDLGEDALATLAGLLPDGPCTVGVWSGWGGLTGGTRITFVLGGGADAAKTEHGPFGVDPAIVRAVGHGPLLALPGREYVLLRGSVEELREEGWAGRAGLGDPGMTAPPNLVWPDDESWFVATEIDFDSTIVAGSEELIGALLRSPGLEAARVTPDADLSSEGDVVNRDQPRGNGLTCL